MLALRRKATASLGAIAALAATLVGGVAAGGPAAASSSTGAVYAWGENVYGELGNGTKSTNSEVPVKASLPAGVTAAAVAASQEDSLILTSTGAIYGWGEDTWGELGNGERDTETDVPVEASLPAGVTATAVAAGDLASLALTSTGAVYGFGDNSWGELGNGTLSSSDVPVLVSLPAGVTATAVSAGEEDGFALTSTGAIYAWGSNEHGELGDGTETNTDTPVLVSLPAGVTATAIAAGVEQTLALTSTGAVYAWGGDGYGQLGIGTTTDSEVPVLVDLPAGVSATAVAANYSQSLAMTSTGSVYAWGYNEFGEVGDGTTTQRDSPVPVSLPAGVQATAVSAGEFYSMALTSTGSVYAWGDNEYGALGNGTTTNSDTPVPVSLPAGVTAAAVAAGEDSALAVTTGRPLQGSPTVTGVAPASGSRLGGTTVTVTGTAFTGAAQVLFGSTAATGLVVSSDTQLTVTSPAHAAGGLNVRVVTSAGKSNVTAADEFTYLSPPKVSGVSPTSGPAAGGTPVTVTGSGFTDATQVLFGSTVATGLVVSSDTQLTVMSPAHGAGVMNVRVVTPVGKSGVVAADEFTYIGPPKVTGVLPTSGPGAGGTQVTVMGSGFAGATQVLFGSTAGTIVTVSDTQLTVTSPAHSAAVINVRVVTPAGKSSVVAADQFTYQ